VGMLLLPGNLDGDPDRPVMAGCRQLAVALIRQQTTHCGRSLFSRTDVHQLKWLGN
jgi:hypothetical protein